MARSEPTIMSTSSGKPTLGSQPSSVAGLGGVAGEDVDLGRAHEAGVALDQTRSQSSMPAAEKASVEQLPDGVGLAGGDDVVVGLVLLEHEPHGLAEVAGEAPVPGRVEVAQGELLLQAELDAGHARW